MKYKGEEIAFAKMSLLEQMVKTRQGMCFVWPDEGKETLLGFTFNEDHKGFEPLFIDIQSANAIVLVHSALSTVNKNRFRKMVEDNRGSFATILEFSWSKVSWGPAKK